MCLVSPWSSRNSSCLVYHLFTSIIFYVPFSALYSFLGAMYVLYSVYLCCAVVYVTSTCFNLNLSLVFFPMALIDLSSFSDQVSTSQMRLSSSIRRNGSLIALILSCKKNAPSLLMAMKQCLVFIFLFQSHFDSSNQLNCKISL